MPVLKPPEITEIIKNYRILIEFIDTFQGILCLPVMHDLYRIK